MRLSSETLEYLDRAVKMAWSSECEILVRSPKHRRKSMFKGLSPHIEERGGDPKPGMYAWRMPNGSYIKLVV